jgi:flavin-dependent dehydrogenase
VTEAMRTLDSRGNRAATAGRDAGRVYDAMIVGGGVAGSALAISLAEAGRDVIQIEKSATAHPKMCGEFLSHEALHYLSLLNMDVEALGAVAIEFVRLASRTILATARLPFVSRSLSRERLDEALLLRAEQSGVHLLRHQRVVSLEPEASLEANDARWTALTGAGERLRSHNAFLATGKHDLYGWNRPAGRHNGLLAFKMYWKLSPQEHALLDRHVELVLFPGGYAGLQLVEDGWANLCLLVGKEAFKKASGSWPALLAHITLHSDHLAQRLDGATPRWEKPLTLSSIPYGFVRTEAEGGPWRLGDQSAVIPSFAGDGMSIALHSARLASEIYRAGGSADEYQRRLALDVSRQVRLATLLSKALVDRRGQPALSAFARLWPGVLAYLAKSTRIRTRAMLG